MALERGTLLHKRYRVVEILGQGGMGSVYRAVDENLGVDVALKENLFTTDEYARQFRLEAVILANLRHPNLPRVTDHFVIGDQGQYLVMDYIEGEDLRQRMERLGMISEDEAVTIGAAICDALTYLHTRRPPILHRDIKPGNVKITPDGHIFLVDFGLAKVMQGSQATTTGARAMTPGYSPPEQYGTARTDPRTDIYSLGATLYAALTGVIPEDGLARAMDNAQLTPLRKRNPKVSKRLAAVIEKAMAIDPNERYQTAEEFKKALLAAKSRTEQLTGSYVVTPPPPSHEGPPPMKTPPFEPPADQPLHPPLEAAEEKPFVPARKKKRRSSCFSQAVLFSLFLIAAFLLWINFPDGRTTLSRWLDALRIATSAIAQMSPSPSSSPQLEVTETQASPLPLPTEPALLTVTPSPLPPSPMPTFTLAAIATPSLTPTPEATLTPSPTPIGGGYGQFAFASARTGIPQIYLAEINLEGNTPKIPLVNLSEGACQPSWSPDGLRLVFTSPCRGVNDKFEDAKLYVVNADGTGLTPLEIGAGGGYDPAWSPDGTRIAFASRRNGRPSIYLLDLVNSTVTPLFEATRSFFEARWPVWSPFGNQLLFVANRYNVYEIWSITDTGLNPQQVVFSGPDYYDLDPAWTPDGQVVLFIQRKVGPSTKWLMQLVYEERGLGKARTVAGAPTPLEDVEVSPDGLWLLLEGWSDKVNRDIYLMSLDTKTLVRLTQDPLDDFDPTWRPLNSP